MAARLLLLVCAGALLHSAEAQDPYDQLSDSYKKGVDLALEPLNTHVGVKHHFRFLRTVEKREHDVSLSFTQNIHKGFIYTVLNFCMISYFNLYFGSLKNIKLCNNGIILKIMSSPNIE
ncbi:hypothetical protein AMECASPLE_017617 [Ameca splendens]|uniref:Uncharacterized protein n=1 Tax=Ameca splendens TaxID=208324 RepID=A0ABV1A8X7_9TELE